MEGCCRLGVRVKVEKEAKDFYKAELEVSQSDTQDPVDLEGEGGRMDLVVELGEVGGTLGVLLEITIVLPLGEGEDHLTMDHAAVILVAITTKDMDSSTLLRKRAMISVVLSMNINSFLTLFRMATSKCHPN